MQNRVALFYIIIVLGIASLYSCSEKDNNKNDKTVTIDSASFVALSHMYGIDKNHVYWFVAEEAKIITGADPKTFHVIDFTFSKDKNSVYNKVELDKIEKLPNVDVASFTMWDDGYYYDKSYIYGISGNILAGVTPLI